jgi:hypothetical protein
MVAGIDNGVEFDLGCFGAFRGGPVYPSIAGLPPIGIGTASAAANARRS